MRGKQKIIIIGAGGHARSCVEVIENDGNFEIMGFIGTESEVGMSILGYRVIGSDTDLEQMRGSCDLAFVAVGQINSAITRRNFYGQLKNLKFQLPTIVSSNAYVSKHATIGEGTIVMPGAVIMPSVAVGINCIVNSKALLEHEVQIGDNSHISTGTIINGGSTIGKECFVGSGTVVREGITVAENCFIGMNSTVTSNLPANSRFTNN